MARNERKKMDSWTDDLTHEKLTTPEAKTNLSKFETQDDAHIAYLELQKTAGKPYKLPKSLDAVEKWPDENDKKAFREGLDGLFKASNIRPEGIKSEDELDDIDFAKGYADARTENKEMTAALKKYAVEKKWPKYIVAELIDFINPFNQQLKNTVAKDLAAEADKVKESLVVLYGDEDSVNKNYDAVRKLIQNHCGLSAAEYDSFGKEFVEKVLMKNAVMSKGLMNLANDLVKEGESEPTGGKGGEPKKMSMAERQNKEMPETTKRLGWRK